MNTYTYVLLIKLTPQSAPNVRVGTVSCKSFGEAMDIVLDSEGESWEFKRAHRELISLSKVLN